MELTWNLDVYYKSCEDEAFTADMEKFSVLSDALTPALVEAKEQAPADGLTTVLTALEEYNALAYNLFGYLQLRQSVDTANPQIASLLANLGRKMSESTGIRTEMEEYIASIPDLEAVLETTPFLQEYRFLCMEIKNSAKHRLSKDIESVMSKMNLTGGDAWGKLFDYLTSTVKVDYKGGIVTLSEIRNMAYSADAEVRKSAYEAEIAAYDKVRDSIAFALNNIKGQVTMEAAMRGYESPLAMTLEKSRMKKESLDAMFSAMKNSLHYFHKYLRAKAKLLGHEGGLPWYDLFAPVGENHKEFTVEETRDYLVHAFEGFAPDSAAMIAQAFDDRWIDFMPKAGKVGGAFCAGVFGKDQSRILTNFSGDFDSVNTLAHELGHAYHGRMVNDQRIMNQDYPMQIAETASTFNEVHLALYALSNTDDKNEKLSLLETLLAGATQTICDIYSRFLFEDAVFNRCQSEFLMPDGLCQIMMDAQKTAYGEGLNHDILHPYMWACKGHYYSSGLSYYNFPYAYGCMFSMGLYTMFQKEGEAFLPKYRALLHATPVKTLEEIGEMAGIDITTPDFWQQSLDAYGKLVEEYVALAE